MFVELKSLKGKDGSILGPASYSIFLSFVFRFVGFISFTSLDSDQIHPTCPTSPPSPGMLLEMSTAQLKPAK